MKRIFFLFIFIILSAGLVSSQEVCVEETCEIPEEQDEIDIVKIYHAEGSVCIIYFYGEGCPSCARVEPFIEELGKRYGNNIEITKLEVYHNLKNYQAYNKYCGLQSIPIEDRKIPLVAISDKFYVGVTDIKNNLEAEIERILETGERICPLEGEATCHITVEGNQTGTDPLIPGLKEKITLPLIIGTGLVDGINPCAFAVLIFLLAILLEISNNKKRMIRAGAVYVAAVYITYFSAGIGLLTAIQTTGMSRLIVKIAALVAIITGLINIKDYFWYGKGISLGIPASKRQVVEKWAYRANIPSAIVLGFLVSMFELPCTGSVYLGILAMLANTVTRAGAVGYLLIYNFMFILPLMVIILAVIFGMKAEHIENWRAAKRNIMKLILGLVLLMLGLFLLFGVV